MLPLVIRPFLFICLFLPFDTLLISTFISLCLELQLRSSRPGTKRERERLLVLLAAWKNGI
jgi:hypothetical protein